MSVTGTGRIRFLPFKQFGAPFPAGIWLGTVFAAGDASGGFIFLNLELNLLTEPFTALILTLEQYELQPSDVLARSYLMEANGFTQVPGANRFPRIAFQVNPTLGGPAAIFATDLLQKPFYLGQVSRAAGIDTQIRTLTQNIDLESYIVHALGYYWTPDAINAPGGPQRPPGALFGT